MVTFKDGIEHIQEQFGATLMSLFSAVTDERRDHYAAHPNLVPKVDQVPRIIKSYARENAVWSLAAAAVPGPIGLATIIPEMVKVTKNQIRMVADVAMAHRRPDMVCATAAAGIITSAAGVGGTGLLVIQGQRILIRRANLRVMQRTAGMFGRSLTQRAVKSTVTRWVPAVGAVAMGAWSRYATMKVGHHADHVFRQDVQLVEEPGEAVEVPNPTDAGPQDSDRRVVHVTFLINLMKADRANRPEESAFIEPMLNELPAGVAEALRLGIGGPRPLSVDYSLLKDSPEDSLALLVDMVALANRDGQVHPAERLYIQQVAQRCGYSEADVNSLMEWSDSPPTPGDMS